MITFNGILVSVGGDERERLATIEDGTGSTRIVSVERLRGTKGGIMEVIVRWREVMRAEKASKVLKQHRHRKSTSGRDYCFHACVNPEACREGAHGNITRLETCSCGATRSVNLNGLWSEYGPWIEKRGEL